jgi:deoxycytidine triphosphate deaminase
MILPAQNIRKLCTQGWMRPTDVTALKVDGFGRENVEVVEFINVKMITPFVERGEFMGKTFGLGSCTYDFTLDQVLTEDNELLSEYVVEPLEAVLASTKEFVDMPFNVCGSILDKSSWARMFMSAFNTHFDPGFYGYPTLELVNLSKKPIHLIQGMPIIQMKFEQLIENTELPYKGKYNGQPARPIMAIEGQGPWGCKTK